MWLLMQYLMGAAYYIFLSDDTLWSLVDMHSTVGPQVIASII